MIRRVLAFALLVLMIATVGILEFACEARADWKDTLEAQFDIVETFEGLKDWHGCDTQGNITTASCMPHKLDDSDSRWTYYSLWTGTPSVDWIKARDPADTWRGKNFCLDYLDSNAVQGPSRFGFSIGDSPDDGYPSDVYVFFMNKYYKSFFPYDAEAEYPWLYYAYLKTFEVGTGFREIEQWGTVEEQQAAANTEQVRNAYGLNFSVFNFTSYYGPKIRYNTYVAHVVDEVGVYGCEHCVVAPDGDLSTPLEAEAWFGLEYHLKKSSPAGTASGTIEVWIYSATGTVLAHDIIENAYTFADSTTALNHSYNKFVWGGNRFDEDFGGRTDGHASTTGELYVDDIVVDGERIGPTYFSLLNATGGKKIWLLK